MRCPSWLLNNCEGTSLPEKCARELTCCYGWQADGPVLSVPAQGEPAAATSPTSHRHGGHRSLRRAALRALHQRGNGSRGGGRGGGRCSLERARSKAECRGEARELQRFWTESLDLRVPGLFERWRRQRPVKLVDAAFFGYQPTAQKKWLASGTLFVLYILHPRDPYRLLSCTDASEQNVSAPFVAKRELLFIVPASSPLAGACLPVSAPFSVCATTPMVPSPSHKIHTRMQPPLRSNRKPQLLPSERIFFSGWAARAQRHLYVPVL